MKNINRQNEKKMNDYAVHKCSMRQSTSLAQKWGRKA